MIGHATEHAAKLSRLDQFGRLDKSSRLCFVAVAMKIANPGFRRLTSNVPARTFAALTEQAIKVLEDWEEQN